MMKHVQTQVNQVSTTTTLYQDIHNSIQQLPTVTTSQLQQCDANSNFDSEKKNIYRHPLFALVAALFDKCEQATHSLDGASQQSVAESFQADLSAFVQRLEQERKPVYTENHELDQLMVQTIQVLCIHLRELEKVNELCKDFCTRYITCLKQKYLVDVISELESSDASLSGGVPDDALSDVGFSAHGPPTKTESHSQPATATASPSTFRDYQSAYAAYAGTGQHYAPAVTPNRAPAPYYTPSNAQPFATTPYAPHTAASNGSGASQRGAQNVTAVMCGGLEYAAGFLLGSPSGPVVLPGGPVQQRSTSVEADTTAKAQKRGVLPKSATQVMKSWLFQHLVHPYPTEDEKRQMAAQTNLTLLQVNNWFINARRRVLQPRIDAANPELAKRKKSSNARPACQRFWPANLAQLPTKGAGHNSQSSNNADSVKDDPARSSAAVEDDEDEEDGSSMQHSVSTAPSAFVGAPQTGFIKQEVAK